MELLAAFAVGVVVAYVGLGIVKPAIEARHQTQVKRKANKARAQKAAATRQANAAFPKLPTE